VPEPPSLIAFAAARCDTLGRFDCTPIKPIVLALASHQAVGVPTLQKASALIFYIVTASPYNVWRITYTRVFPIVSASGRTAMARSVYRCDSCGDQATPLRCRQVGRLRRFDPRRARLSSRRARAPVHSLRRGPTLAPLCPLRSSVSFLMNIFEAPHAVARAKPPCRWTTDARCVDPLCPFRTARNRIRSSVVKAASHCDQRRASVSALLRSRPRHGDTRRRSHTAARAWW